MPSHDFLLAETCAWPFWSDAAFDSSATVLVELASGQLDIRTHRLANELEGWLRPRARGVSLNALAGIRAHCWFDLHRDGSSRHRLTVPLARLLTRVATDHLTVIGDRVALRRDTKVPEADLAERWRRLTFAFPADLIIAALSQASGRPPPCDYVDVSSAGLSSALGRVPLVNVHLHLGAALPFELLWTHLMSAVALSPPDAAKLDAVKAPPFGSGERFLRMLSSAAAARILLARFLWRPVGGNDFGRFATGFASAIPDAAALLAAIAALAVGGEPPRAARLRRVLARLSPPSRTELASVADIVARDPLSAYGKPTAAQAETHFLHAALDRLERGPPDSLFGATFWQYVRVRGATFRWVTHEAGTAGLDWFNMHFDRLRVLKAAVPDRVLAESALALESRSGDLHTIEVRTAPKRHWREIEMLGRDVLTAPHAPTTRRALILHFLREYRPDVGPPHADPRGARYRSRYGRYFVQRRREAIAIERAIRLRPWLLDVVRGLDACKLELAVPTWVLKPLFERIRAKSRAVAGGNARELRLTLHAGEEFVRLVQGIRRVHEPLEFGLLRRGDRLGHALALGVDPEDWAVSHRVVAQSAMERLDDLLWEWARHTTREMRAPPARAKHLGDEIAHHSEQIYGRPCAAPDLVAARELRHNSRALALLGYPNPQGTSPPSSGPLRLLWSYLADAEVYVRGEHILEVATSDGETKVVTGLLKWIRRKLSAAGVAIEATPTSNVLVGDGSMDSHPLFRWVPFDSGGSPRQRRERPRVAVGDDDPITFATNLGQEIAHLYHAARRRGMSEDVARKWTVSIARGGHAVSFALAGGYPRHRPTTRRR